MAALVRLLIVALGVGALLGIVTKAVLWLFDGVIHVLWDWLPDQLDLEPSSLGYLLALLGLGGLLVGLGQKYLGYYPEPLETVVASVKQGDGVDYRTIPRTVANSIAALGFGGPLGPEAALVSVIGGTFFWARQRMDRLALQAYQGLRGTTDDDLSKPWQYAPLIVAGIALFMVFRALPGGIDLSFVPRYDDPGSAAALIPALIAGLVGGVLGLVSSELEAHIRALRLFDRAPVLFGIAGGIVVALLAGPSFLVLFSGAENAASLFDGSTSDAGMAYAAGAKWIALMVVFACGWKGGPVFPLIFISGGLALAAGGGLGIEPVILYAGAIAGACTGALRSMAFGALATLLVVPASMLALIVAGAAGAGLVIAVHSRRTPEPQPAG